MAFTPSTLNEQRRPSLADSIEVTIVCTETSTYLPTPPTNNPPPARAGVFELDHDEVLPFTRLDLAPAPHSVSLYNLPPPVYTFPPSTAPPPPLTSSSSAQSQLTPLSFFPPSSSSSSSSSHPHSHSQQPPSYRTVPRTTPERLFLYGCASMPLGLIGLGFWFAGASWLVSSQSLQSLSEVSVEDQRWPGHVESEGEGEREGKLQSEALALWRQEERIWARRCVVAFVGGIVLCALVGGVVYGVVVGL